MSTHKWYCAWCGHNVYCTDDSHVFGSGQACCDYEYQDEQPKPVEFCSLVCFVALQSAMTRRLEVAQEMHPEWFVGDSK